MMPPLQADLPATALIAEDEPLLAENLRAELARLWPALGIVASAAHGQAALEAALALRPQILFLDIRMPGLSGLELVEALADEWPLASTPWPLIVFVSAYDQYALKAFEQAALDYLLKPVQPERLAQCCTRLQAALGQRQQQAQQGQIADAEATLAQLRQLLAASQPIAATSPPPLLRLLQVGVGHSVLMLPMEQVLYFEAADKYVRVLTAEREHLLRTSLRELLPQLDAQLFWQVHRGLVVRAAAVARAERDEAGRVSLQLHQRPERLLVSRLYAHRFKAH